MRFLLRRILWLLPSLLVASLLAFAGIGEGGHGSASERRLPAIFNPAPEDVKSLALGAMGRVAQGGPEAPEAAHTLERLGGAALPFVLPRLDGLPPEARARVAISLAPLGRRMRVGSEEELTHSDQAVLFWARFWEDRALEFRPAVAKRLARRLAERSLATRQEEILGLDTYAISALLRELGAIRNAGDVARVARVTEVLALVTGQTWRVTNGDELTQAGRVAEAWRAWWAHHRYEYQALDGPRRLAAMLLETRSAQWVTEAIRVGLHETSDSVSRRFARAAPVTLWLTATMLVGSWAGGLLVALVSLYAPRSRGERCLAYAVLAMAAVPAALLAALCSPLGAPMVRAVGAALLVTLLGAAWVGWYLRAAARTIRLEEHYRTLVAGGIRPWRIALLGAREIGILGSSLVAVTLPEVLSVVLLVEHASGLPGLGALTVAAVSQRDAAWLALVAILCAGAVWTAQAVGDLALGRLDPRLRRALGASLPRGLEP